MAQPTDPAELAFEQGRQGFKDGDPQHVAWANGPWPWHPCKVEEGHILERGPEFYPRRRAEARKAYREQARILGACVEAGKTDWPLQKLKKRVAAIFGLSMDTLDEPGGGSHQWVTQPSRR